eukprot:5834550-Amphidinium_carterae.1
MAVSAFTAQEKEDKANNLSRGLAKTRARLGWLCYSTAMQERLCAPDCTICCVSTLRKCQAVMQCCVCFPHSDEACKVSASQ